MIFSEILTAMFTLGTPVALVSWYLINRLYLADVLSKDDDFRSVKNSVAKIKKNKAKDDTKSNFAEKRWMKFGGGFYGITAFTTWIIIEVGEVLSFVGNLPMVDELFKEGLVGFLIQLLLNQFQNFISALVWFAYWSDEGRSLIVWVLVPYVGYLAGLYAAGKTWAQLMSAGRNLLSRKPSDDR